MKDFELNKQKSNEIDVKVMLNLVQILIAKQISKLKVFGIPKKGLFSETPN
jgi:hypothetical protein